MYRDSERQVTAREWPLKYAEWNESDHPREPAGSPEGGQFTASGDVFHVTKTESVESIKKKGVIPFQPSQWVQAGNKERYGKGEIFAFEKRDDAVRWAAKMDWEQNSKWGSGKISIVRIKGKGSKWTIDESDPLTQSSSIGKWLKRFGAVKPADITSSEIFEADMLKKVKKKYEDLSESYAADDEEDGVWRTINGSPVFIKKGQSVADAIEQRDRKRESGGHDKGSGNGGKSKTGGGKSQAKSTSGGESIRDILRSPIIFGFGDSMVNFRDATKYIEEKGRDFKSQALPKGYERMTPQECFTNATRLVMDDRTLRYAEGIAVAPSGLPFLHAWAVDRSGNVIDPTWETPEKAKYYGVAYDTKKYLKHIMKTGYYGVIGGDDKSAQQAIRNKGRDLL